MNLFALTQGPARRTLHILFFRAIQNEVETLFRQPRAEFATTTAA